MSPSVTSSQSLLGLVGIGSIAPSPEGLAMAWRRLSYHRNPLIFEYCCAMVKLYSLDRKTFLEKGEQVTSCILVFLLDKIPPFGSLHGRSFTRPAGHRGRAHPRSPREFVRQSLPRQLRHRRSLRSRRTCHRSCTRDLPAKEHQKKIADM